MAGLNKYHGYIAVNGDLLIEISIDSHVAYNVYYYVSSSQLTKESTTVRNAATATVISKEPLLWAHVIAAQY